MNRKQLSILIVLLVVLGIAGLSVYKHNQTSWQGSGRQGAALKLLGDLPINDVASIVIKGGTNQLELVKKDGMWRVKERNDYPANFSEISGFLLKAADLKAVQTEEIGPSHFRSGAGEEGRHVAGEGTQRLPSQLFRDQRIPAESGGPQGGPDRRNRPLAFPIWSW